jgi:hypothetical protein
MTIPRNLSFLADGASSTGVLSVSYGGTGLTSFTANQIHFGSFSTSANLAFNSSTNILTVGTGVTGGIAGGTF